MRIVRWAFDHHNEHAMNYEVEEPAPVLRADRLYSLDNGRIACGRPNCAGQSAAFTGFTRSGMRVRQINAEDRRDFRAYGLVLKCEGCGQRDQAR